jgi:uncharacterized protein YaeQ
MGRQITVKLADLEKAGCYFDCRSEVYESEYVSWDGQDAHSEEVQEWVDVTLPSGRRIGSGCSDCLNFDCRSIDGSANAWMEKWLIENKVPYVQG